MRDRYRHKATGAEALITIREFSSGEHPKLRLELLTEPTEPVVKALRLTIHHGGQMVYCCEMGERYYPSPCPLHGMKGAWIPDPLRADPFILYQAELERDWEPVS